MTYELKRRHTTNRAKALRENKMTFEGKTCRLDGTNVWYANTKRCVACCKRYAAKQAQIKREKRLAEAGDPLLPILDHHRQNPQPSCIAWR